MIATRANMRAVSHLHGVFALDPMCPFDRYSATPGNYFMLADDEPLTNEAGDPLVLAREVAHIEEVEL